VTNRLIPLFRAHSATRAVLLCVPGAVNADTTDAPTVPRNTNSTTSNAHHTRRNKRRRRGDPRRGGRATTGARCPRSTPQAALASTSSSGHAPRHTSWPALPARAADNPLRASSQPHRRVDMHSPCVGVAENALNTPNSAPQKAEIVTTGEMRGPLHLHRLPTVATSLVTRAFSVEVVPCTKSCVSSSNCLVSTPSAPASSSRTVRKPCEKSGGGWRAPSSPPPVRTRRRRKHP